MTQEKAREYFSSYYEGSLDRGLKQSLEQKLKADSQLADEYRSFERVILELNRMQLEEIEVPMYLSDRIATRIEQAQAGVRKPSIWVSLQRYGFAAFAAVAILGAGVGLFFRSRHAEAGLIPTNSSESASVNWPSEAISVSRAPDGAKFEYTSATAKVVEILDSSKTILKSYTVDPKQTLTANLTNPNPDAAVFELKVSESGPDEFVAVPGTQKSDTQLTSGSVQDFAVALANHYGAPVILNVKNPVQTLSWTLDGGSSRDLANHVLEGSGYDVSLSSTGVLTISG